MRIYLELRGCAGGKEAEIFANELMLMYLKYSKKENLYTEIIRDDKTKIVLIDGNDKKIYTLLSEGGIHKVQRISETGKKDKMHTSTVSVAVLKVGKDQNIVIKDDEIEINTFRASGNGGQHVNTTDSAVRIHYKPLDITVVCQNERSQFQNKEFAFEILKAKITEIRNIKNNNKMNNLRKEQVGDGDRAEARRTYNFVRNEVIDHLSNKKCKLKDILNKANLNSIK